MRPILLKFLKYLGTTFLALSVFILILPYFVSLNTYKGEIVSKAKEALGRDISIDGDIKSYNCTPVHFYRTRATRTILR